MLGRAACVGRAASARAISARFFSAAVPEGVKDEDGSDRFVVSMTDRETLSQIGFDDVLLPSVDPSEFGVPSFLEPFYNGVTSYMEFAMSCGVPLWGAIALGAATLRLSFLPLLPFQLRRSAVLGAFFTRELLRARSKFPDADELRAQAEAERERRELTEDTDDDSKKKKSQSHDKKKKSSDETNAVARSIETETDQDGTEMTEEELEQLTQSDVQRQRLSYLAKTLPSAIGKPFLQWLPFMFVQIPPLLAFAWSVRCMSMDPSWLLHMETGGVGNYLDLTRPDQSGALPLLGVMTSYSALEYLKQLPRGVSFNNPVVELLQVATILTTPLAVWAPVCIFPYWLTMATFGIGTRVLINSSERLRKIINVPDILEIFKQDDDRLQELRRNIMTPDMLKLQEQKLHVMFGHRTDITPDQHAQDVAKLKVQMHDQAKDAVRLMRQKQREWNKIQKRKQEEAQQPTAANSKPGR